MSTLGAQFVAITHSKLWMNMTVHMPLAAALVLWQRHWWMVAIASSIGLVKDVWLDRKFATPKPPLADCYVAAGFYVVGAMLGALGAGMVYSLDAAPGAG